MPPTPEQVLAVNGALLLGQSSPGETERYVHRLPDQTLAQRTRAAIDHAFPAGPVSPAQHGADQAGAVFSSGVCGWACRRCGLGGLKRGPACGPDTIPRPRMPSSVRVRRQGLEPRTRGLRVRCSANSAVPDNAV